MLLLIQTFLASWPSYTYLFLGLNDFSNLCKFICQFRGVIPNNTYNCRGKQMKRMLKGRPFNKTAHFPYSFPFQPNSRLLIESWPRIFWDRECFLASHLTDFGFFNLSRQCLCALYVYTSKTNPFNCSTIRALLQSVSPSVHFAQFLNVLPKDWHTSLESHHVPGGDATSG